MDCWPLSEVQLCCFLSVIETPVSRTASAAVYFMISSLLNKLALSLHTITYVLFLSRSHLHSISHKIFSSSS